MTTAEIEKKAQALAEAGIDRHTIRADAEVRLGRKLKLEETDAVQAAWVASEPKRVARLRRLDRSA